MSINADSATVLQSRLAENLDAYADCMGSNGASKTVKPSSSSNNKARKTIHARRNLHGDKAMSPQSLAQLTEMAKKRNAPSATSNA